MRRSESFPVPPFSGDCVARAQQAVGLAGGVLVGCVRGCGPGDWLFPSAAGNGAGPVSVRALQRTLVALV